MFFVFFSLSMRVYIALEKTYFVLIFTNFLLSRCLLRHVKQPISPGFLYLAQLWVLCVIMAWFLGMMMWILSWMAQSGWTSATRLATWRALIYSPLPMISGSFICMICLRETDLSSGPTWIFSSSQRTRLTYGPRLGEPRAPWQTRKQTYFP